MSETPNSPRGTTRRITRQTITEVDILNGQAKADLVRDRDPAGHIVLHAVRKNSYVHERMFNGGKGALEKESFDAAEQFRRFFERGQLVGHYAKLDMFRTSKGKHEINDGTVNARKRAVESLDALGRRADGTPNYSADVVWHVVGEGMTLEEWAQRVRWKGGTMDMQRPIDKNRAAGILIGALERLALHYGFIRVGEIREQASKRHFAKGVSYLHQFITVYAAASPQQDRDALKRLIADIERRAGKFLAVAT